MACPRVMAAPENIKAGFMKEGRCLRKKQGIHYVTPFVSLGEPRVVPQQLYTALKNVLELEQGETKQAVAAGYKALDAFNCAMRGKGREILTWCAQKGRPCILVLGRPYHMDTGIGHEIEVDLQAHGYPILWAPVLSDRCRPDGLAFWSGNSRWVHQESDLISRMSGSPPIAVTPTRSCGAPKWVPGVRGRRVYSISPVMSAVWTSQLIRQCRRSSKPQGLSISSLAIWMLLSQQGVSRSGCRPLCITWRSIPMHSLPKSWPGFRSHTRCREGVARGLICDPPISAPYDLLFQDGTHARSGDCFLHHTLRTWATHLTWNQRLCDTFASPYVGSASTYSSAAIGRWRYLAAEIPCFRIISKNTRRGLHLAGSFRYISSADPELSKYSRSKWFTRSRFASL